MGASLFTIGGTLPTLNMTDKGYGIFYNGAISGVRMGSTADGLATIPMVARGASGQTADLQQWQSNAGARLAAVDKNGTFFFSGASSTGSILPTITNSYDLGSSSNYWRKLFAKNVSSTNIDALNYVSTTNLFVGGTSISGLYHKQGGNAFGTTSTIGTTDNYDWNIKTNNATRLTVLRGGNIGIGTVNPRASLDVTGNIWVGHNGAGNRGIYIGTSPYQASLLYNSTSGNLDITPRTGYNSIFTAGNVGIGTTNPYLFKLTVQGSVAPSTTNSYDLGGTANYWRRLYATNVSSSRIDALTYVSSSKFYAGPGTAAAPSITFQGDQDTGLYNSSANAIGFVTQGSLRATIGNSYASFGQIQGLSNNAYDLGSSGTYWRKLFATNVSSTNIDALGYVSTTKLYLAGSQFVPGNYFVQGGNAFAATGTLGTTDNYNLTFKTNNTSRMTILSGGNVGIGTVNPSARLQVDTLKVYASGNYDYLDSTASSGLIAQTAGSFSLKAGNNGFQMNYNNSSTGDLSFFGGGTTPVFSVADNGQGYFKDRLGVGATSPANKLTITGTGAATADADLGFNVTTTSGTSSWTIGADKSDGGKFKISSSTALGTFDRFVINGKGYVGIGTATPHSQFSVNGYSNWQTSIDGGSYPQVSRLAYESDGTGYGFGIGRKDVTGANYTDYMYFKDGGNIGIGTSNPVSYKLTIAGTIAPSSTNSYDLGATKHSWRSLYVSSTSYLAGVNAGGNVVPRTTLTYDLGSSSAYWRKLFAKNVSSTNIDALGYVSTTKLYLAGSQFLPGNYFVQGGNAFAATGTLGTTDNYNLTLKTNNTSQLTILNGGNVGVGTVNPGAKLEVNGNIAIAYSNGLEGRISSGSYTAGISGFYPFASAIGANDTVIKYAMGNNNFVIKHDTVNVLTINSSGKLGLNNPAPANSITINGYGATTADADLGFNVTTTSGTSSWTIGADKSDGGKFKISSSTALGTFDRLVINGKGYVGIGTASPTEQLQVNGRIMAVGSGYVANPTGPIFGQYNATVGYVQAPANGEFDIWSDGTSAIAKFLDNMNTVLQGNLGIGVLNPYLYKLTVAGTVAPSSTNSYDLGSAAHTWRSLYVGSTSYLAAVNAAGNITPTANNTYDLGSSSYYWRKLFATNVSSTNIDAVGYVSTTNLYIKGVAVTSSVPTLQQVTTQGADTNKWIQFAGATSTGNILPSSNNVYDLGSTAKAWRNFYATGTVNGGTLFANAGVTIWGNSAGASNTSTDLTAIGYNAAHANTGGNWITAIGYQALQSNTIGHANTAIGWKALRDNTTGSGNTAVGDDALMLITVANTNDHNSAFGSHALGSLTTGAGNVALGYSSMNAATGGSSNTAVGAGSIGAGVSTGSYNVAIGTNSLNNNTSGYGNTALGYVAGAGNTEGAYNTSLGYFSLYTNATGNFNTAIGGEAAKLSLNKSGLTVIGYAAMPANAEGTNSTIIGNNAFYNETTGNYNTALGQRAGYSNISGSSNVFLGYLAGYYETGSNKLFIDNTNRASEADARTKALIYGVFDAATANQYLTVNGQLQVTGTGKSYIGGNVGIGTTNPYLFKLTVQGSVAPSTTNSYDLGGTANYWRRLYASNVSSSRIDALGYVSTTKVIAGKGSYTAPSFTFQGDPDTGLYSDIANNLFVSTNATNRFQFGTANNITYQSLIPNNNNAKDIGSYGYALRNIYVSSTSNLAAINASGNIVPTANGFYDLGTSSLYWRKLFVKNVSSTNIDALGYVSSTKLFVNGSQILSANPNLQQVTDQGYFTTRPIGFAGASSTGSIIPTITVSYDLGSSSLYWRKLFASNVSSSNIDALGYVSSSKFIAGSGTNSNPAYSFSAQSGTGLYYTASALNFSISNTARLVVTAQGAAAAGFGISNVTNQLAGGLRLGRTGQINWASYGSADDNLGLSRYATGTLAVGNGTQGDYTGKIIAGNIGLGVNNPYLFSLTTAGSIGPSSTNAYDLGGTANYWRRLYATNVSTSKIDALGYVSTTKLITGMGSAAAPSISFQGDPNTGIYQLAADSIDFSLNGVNKWDMNITNANWAVNLTPQVNNTYNLGSATVSWKNLYVSSTAYMAGINAGGTITPRTTLAYDLGTSSNYWRKLFVKNVSSTNIDALGYVSTTKLYLAGSQFVPGNYFVQGGNAFAATGTLGTTDNYNLTFKTNNTSKMTILSGGNVGIGTVNPATKLEVAGDATMRNIYPDGNGTRVLGQTTNAWANIYGNFIGTSGSGSGKTVFSMTSASTNYGNIQVESTANGGTWSLGYQAAPNTIIGTNVLSWNGQGKVGIGSLTPANRLTVAGIPAYANADLGFTATTTGANSSWTIGVDHADGGKFKISSSTALGTNDRFVIDGKGRIGVGTSSPIAKLHIVDTTAASSFTGNNTQGLKIQGANTAADYAILGFDGNALTYNKNKAQIGAKFTGSGSYLQFGTSNDYSLGITNIALTIDPTGNIGIGTTNPYLYKLTVAGTIAPSTTNSYDLGASSYYWRKLFVKNVSSTNIDALGYVSTTNLYLGGTSISGLYHKQGGNAFGATSTIGTTDNYNLTLKTNNTSRITILNSGNVGIGMVNPSEKLEVSGNVKIAQNANKYVIFNDVSASGLSDFSIGGSGFAFSRPNDGASGLSGFYTYMTAGLLNRAVLASRGDLVFAAGGASTYNQAPEIMRVAATGNVGIGVNNPYLFMLTVAGSVAPSTTNAYDLGGTANYWRRLYATNVSSSRVDALTYVSSTKFFVGIGAATTPSLSFQGDPDTGIYNYAANNLGVSTAGSIKFLFGSSENTSAANLRPWATNTYDLGTSSYYWRKLYTKYVSSTAIDAIGYVSTTNLYLGGTSISGLYHKQGGNAFGVTSTIGTTDVQDINVKTSNATRLTVLRGGKVGIGTTNPSSLLSVAGDTYVTGNLGVGGAPNSLYGIFLNKSFTSSNQAAGFSVNTTHNTTGAFNGAYGFVVNSYIAPNGGTVSYLDGNFSQAMYAGTNNATVSNLYGNFSRLGISGANASGTISNGYAFYIDPIANFATGAPDVTYASNYGLYISNQGSGNGTNGLHLNNSYGLYIASQSGATNNNFALYSVGGNNYFGGNVGIGVTSPTAFKLQVAGNVGPDANNTYDLGSSSLNWRRLYATNVSSSRIDALTYVSSSKFYAGPGTAAAPSITFQGDQDTGLYNSSANAIGFVTQGSLRATIGNSYASFGQIQGLSNNAYDLGSSGTYWRKLFATNVSSTNVDALGYVSTTKIITGSGSATAPSITFQGDPDTGFYRSLSNQISFTAGGSQIAIFDGSAAYLRTVLPASTNSYNLGSTTQYWNKIFVRNVSSTNIDALGYVSTTKLYLSGSQFVPGNYFVQGGNSFSATGTLGTNDAYNLALKTNNTNRLVITSAGKVGVGTVNPYEMLDVYGTAAAVRIKATDSAGYSRFYVENNSSGHNFQFLAGGTTRAGTTFGVSNADLMVGYSNNTKLAIGTADNYDFTLGTNNAAVMTLKNTGNVGIGTANPYLFKLTVAGTVAPSTTNSYDLGSASYRWRGLYTSAGVYASGTVIGAGLTSYGNVNPGTTNQYDLGSAAKQYRALYLSSTTSSSLGVVYKGGVRFIHDYQDPTSVGSGNLFIGPSAGNFTMGPGGGGASLGTANLGIGTQALYSNTTGYQNFGVGNYALYQNTTGKQNVALGFQALFSNTSGSDNTAIGALPLYYNKTGNSNTVIGRNIFTLNTGANAPSGNVGIGYYAFANATSVVGNTAVGTSALQNSAGNFNMGIGYGAGYGVTSGANNTFVGSWSGYNGAALVTGGSNTALGYYTLYNITSAANNIAIGTNAADNLTTGSNNVIIGYNIDAPLAAGSNRLSIGNLIFGTGLDGTGTNISSGNIGIGTTNPYLYKLTVAGGVAPSSTNSYDLGSAAHTWRSLY
ncbi:MAG: hypothetical protein PHH26_03245, partial [Candidatus Thermoplasmatota archaeon]|nr:hypothetical protein [Candidatus Thermoplasmatota archaeon]